jgi:RNA polymerase sigma-70 factor (ECF subfamily)
MEDIILVNRCRQGDVRALQKIYEKYKRYLLVLAVALLGDSSLAEDVLHDTFVSFIEHVDDFRLHGSLKAYLAICVSNKARNYNRTYKREQFKVASVQTDMKRQTLTCNTIICNEELQNLSKAMQQIPYQQREIIMLHLHQGMTFRKIAELCSEPVNTVKSRYRYGIDKLRSVMNRIVL